MFFSITVTIAAGTPVRLANITTPVKRIIFTPLVGSSTALIYILAQDRGNATVQNKTANNFITEIGPASATVPGVPFVIPQLDVTAPLDLIEFAVDGSHTGDTCQVSWEI